MSSILVKLTFKCNLGKTFSAKEALQANLLNDVFEETGQQFTDKVSDSLTLHSMHKIYSLLHKGLCHCQKDGQLSYPSTAAFKEGWCRRVCCCKRGGGGGITGVGTGIPLMS